MTVAASRLVPIRESPSTAIAIAKAPAPTAVPAVAAGVRRGSLVGRFGPDRAVAVVVVGILLGASVISLSEGHPGPNTGGTTGDGPGPRIVIGGGTNGGGGTDAASNGAGPDLDGAGSTGTVQYGAPDPTFDPTAPQSPFAAIDFGNNEIATSVPASVQGPFNEDGTLIKPIAVDTTVPDGSALVKTYKVKAGDTLDEIATKFKVSPMTVVWANDLKSKTDIHKGRELRIPPVTGLIVKVSATDTLDAIAARYAVDSTDILATNGLDDPNLVVGQVLVLPGAKGKAMSEPFIKPWSRISPARGSNVRGPSTYSGGKFIWPVVGGGNYISQYFQYGHGGIDIAADYGSTVRAGGDGIVTFAGWKSNGGGYQVWIAHGSGLYTTYNHMSGVSVGRGQKVSRGQQVGRVGSSGNSSGPHLHFEVWKGPIWDGGVRTNPLGYL